MTEAQPAAVVAVETAAAVSAELPSLLRLGSLSPPLTSYLLLPIALAVGCSYVDLVGSDWPVVTSENVNNTYVYIYYYKIIINISYIDC